MNNNQNKTIHVTAKGIMICYTDTKKQSFIPFENSLHSLQLFGNSFKGRKYQQGYEQDQFSTIQNKMYRDALFGLSHYNSLEIKRMKLTDKFQIQQVHATTQKVLNKWKQQIMNEMVDDFLLSTFPKSSAVKDLVNKTRNATDKKLFNTVSFAELGISKKQIVDKLVNCKVLPESFYQSKAA